MSNQKIYVQKMCSSPMIINNSESRCWPKFQDMTICASPEKDLHFRMGRNLSYLRSDRWVALYRCPRNSPYLEIFHGKKGKYYNKTAILTEFNAKKKKSVRCNKIRGHINIELVKVFTLTEPFFLYLFPLKQ